MNIQNNDLQEEEDGFLFLFLFLSLFLEAKEAKLPVVQLDEQADYCIVAWKVSISKKQYIISQHLPKPNYHYGYLDHDLYLYYYDAWEPEEVNFATAQPDVGEDADIPVQAEEVDQKGHRELEYLVKVVE